MPDYLLPSSQFPGRVVLATSFLPLDFVSCCPHCGTILGTQVDGKVTLHVVDPDWEGYSEAGYGLRPPSPPRTLNRDERSASAKCPYCGGDVDLNTLVQRDPEDFITLKA